MDDNTGSPEELIKDEAKKLGIQLLIRRVAISNDLKHCEDVLRKSRRSGSSSQVRKLLQIRNLIGQNLKLLDRASKLSNEIVRTDSERDSDGE